MFIQQIGIDQPGYRALAREFSQGPAPGTQLDAARPVQISVDRQLTASHLNRDRVVDPIAHVRRTRRRIARPRAKMKTRPDKVRECRAGNRWSPSPRHASAAAHAPPPPRSVCAKSSPRWLRSMNPASGRTRSACARRLIRSTMRLAGVIRCNGSPNSFRSAIPRISARPSPWRWSMLGMVVHHRDAWFRRPAAAVLRHRRQILLDYAVRLTHRGRLAMPQPQRALADCFDVRHGM